jgi:hypothetical protein
MLILTSQEVKLALGRLMQAIYPANNETTLVGVIASSIVWDEVLEFADEVSGIDCVCRQKHNATLTLSLMEATLR